MGKHKKVRPRGTKHKRSSTALPRRILRRLDIAIDEEIGEIIAAGLASENETNSEITYTENTRRLLRRTYSGAELENDDNSENSTAQSSTATKRGAGEFSADQNQIQAKSEKTSHHSKRSSATTDSENHIEQPNVSRWQTHTGA